ncbi:MAG TPA: hypothetical protein VN643_23980 [Pyrinomonadaceae bacterium]|nr:hypothetical protein [Pyrinomonadaceae bacterium]
MKILVVSLFLLLLTAIAIEASMPDEPAPAANSAAMQSAEPDKAAAIRNSLALLLANSGVHVEASLPQFDGRSYKDLHVRWESSVASGQNTLIKQPGIGRFAVLSASKKSGSLPRARSLELSPNQLLAIAVDGKNSLRWWKLLLDPRLVRAEAPNANGDLQGEELYLTKVEFWVAIPDDPDIKEVRLYHPRWTGRDFQLELVSVLTVE